MPGQPPVPPSGRAPSGKSAAGKPGGKKAKSPLWTKFVIGLGALVVLASGTAFALMSEVLHQVNGAFTQVQLLDNQGDVKGQSIDGVINMLMVGLDTRDKNASLGSRADSIIIAHIPASHDRVYMVSIPRDTQVQIPADSKSHYGGGSAKINAAFQFGSQNKGGTAGGFQLLAKTVTQLTGITFQAGLIVNFDGFTDIVKQLGGVSMYVDETTMSLHHGYLTNNPSVHAAPWAINTDGTPNHRIPGTTPVIYKKGFQHLSAYAALDYVRCRDFLPNVDYDRERHQQQFIKALMQEAYDKGISNPLKISSFLKSISQAFAFDGGGASTDDWIFTLKGISPSSMVTIKTNGGHTNTVVVNGSDEEVLSPDSLTLMKDVKDDKVDDFIAAHPTWVA